MHSKHLFLRPIDLRHVLYRRLIFSDNDSNVTEQESPKVEITSQPFCYKWYVELNIVSQRIFILVLQFFIEIMQGMITFADPFLFHDSYSNYLEVWKALNLCLAESTQTSTCWSLFFIISQYLIGTEFRKDNNRYTLSTLYDSENIVQQILKIAIKWKSSRIPITRQRLHHASNSWRCNFQLFKNFFIDLRECNMTLWEGYDQWWWKLCNR